MTASELRKDMNKIADRAEAIEKVAEDIETRLEGIDGTESQICAALTNIVMKRAVAAGRGPTAATAERFIHSGEYLAMLAAPEPNHDGNVFQPVVPD